MKHEEQGARGARALSSCFMFSCFIRKPTILHSGMESSSQPSNFARLLTGDWSQRLAYVVDMMRDVSRNVKHENMKHEITG
jgi:hypothetical protein